MPQSQQFDVLVLGSGTGGKLIAWYMAQSGRRTAVVERRWVGGSCPNIACMPSKNEIASAKVAHLARDDGPYGTVTGFVTGRDREQGRALSVANPSMLASARSRLPIERSEMRDPTEVLRSLFRGLAERPAH